MSDKDVLGETFSDEFSESCTCKVDSICAYKVLTLRRKRHADVLTDWDGNDAGRSPHANLSSSGSSINIEEEAHRRPSAVSGNTFEIGESVNVGSTTCQAAPGEGSMHCPNTRGAEASTRHTHGHTHIFFRQPEENV